MIHLSLNLERSLAARVAFGKFVSSPCQVFVPACYVWPKGSPWPLTIPHTAASQETTMISGEGWSGWGVKIPFRFSAWEARAIQCVPENPPQWGQAVGVPDRSARPLCLCCHSGIWSLMCKTFKRLFSGRLAAIDSSLNKRHESHSATSSSSFSCLHFLPSFLLFDYSAFTSDLLPMATHTAQVGSLSYRCVNNDVYV